MISQRGPTCAVAATVMAARAVGGAGAALELDALARAIPVWPDGVSFFDLEEELARRGLRSLTFRGDAALAARFVAEGVPVVMALDLHGGKHAVTVASYEGRVGGGACTPEPARLGGVDPWLGARFDLDRAALERSQFGGQLYVVWPADADTEARLAKAGLELAPLVAEDRRFRAEELVMRAREHEAPNEQMLTLLERAAAEDPTWDVPRALAAEVRRALGR